MVRMVNLTIAPICNMGYKEKIVVIPLILCAVAIFGFGIYNTACNHSFFSFLGC
ncbi:MAG: hypothetical protein HOF89_00095 [Candidatus Nitrosopelagicus sp.]|nr:hypothetical protein [Candidatus Nitrosopelagicus sp.]